MNRKTIIMICMGVGATVGAWVPTLLGDHDLLSGWSILGGMVGGFIGIWLGVKVARALS